MRNYYREKKVPSKSIKRKGIQNLYFSMLVQDKPKPKFGKFNKVRNAVSPFWLVMTDRYQLIWGRGRTLYIDISDFVFHTSYKDNF